jgi:hypothetical protein
VSLNLKFRPKAFPEAIIYNTAVMQRVPSDRHYGGLHANESEDYVKFFNHSGTSKSFLTYLSPPDILWIPASKVLTKVDPRTAKSCTYVISENKSYCVRN